uniref:Sugar ABC transporter ATP-binding protein n=1 Tax=Thermogemmatispora argillosa TaxID=2045280 RepID=A0A455SZA3_9CHLR|nr:sugar ABC transporter ATP-binding protein [Thermogemmatispora argillosa]
MAITLSAKHVVKRYGGVVALRDGNLEVRSGEVMALVGANGSGKSTLNKIITGVVAPDEGQLLLNGQMVRFPTPQAARRRGIVAVYQELSLVDNMTVEENIWLAHEPLWPGGLVQRRAIRKRTQELLSLFQGTVSQRLQPETPVAALSPDEKQIVEILKALSLQPALMLLDEASASLDARQVGRLFELMTHWKQEGMALIFISHRMEEILRVADRITVLRNGESVLEAYAGELSTDELVQAMVGQTVAERYIQRREQQALSKPCLVVEGLRTNGLHGISFTLHEGEILGLGGLRGQGQSEILLALFGAIPFEGRIFLAGKPVHFTHPHQAVKAGLAFVPGERSTQGLLLIRSVLENLHLPSWARYGMLLRLGQARRDAARMADRLKLLMPSLDAAVSSLSGGNAQKVVLGKWLLRQPRVLLLDDPTKGVDVGARAEFYQILAELREAGTAILLYSSEDDELLGLCDRVLVLHSGEVQAELAQASLTHAELVAASMGTTVREEASS